MKLCHFTAIAGIALAIVPNMLASKAVAAPNSATVFEERVEYHDLDLSTQRGVALLESRIKIRIARLCDSGGRDGASLNLERQCREDARASAAPQVRLAVAQANAERTRLAAKTAAHVPENPGA